MGKEIPFPGRVLAGFSREDDRQALLRGRDPTGRLSKSLGSGVITFPTLKESDCRWPVRIYTLGRFSLTVDGKPLDPDSASAQQPLEFLKALIALGGREVEVMCLTAALWPDAGGVAARPSLDAVLESLDHALGGERALVWSDGSIGLDPRSCWVDAWDFERALAMARRILNEDSTGKEAVRLDLLSSRLAYLYRGHFLSDEHGTPWPVSLRERLRSQFIHFLLDAGLYWEARGLWDKAISCYRRGLELDDLIESFYQRLMVCCRETRRIDEGLAVYRRCRKVLSLVLGLKPAPETEALHQTLTGACHKTADG